MAPKIVVLNVELQVKKNVAQRFFFIREVLVLDVHGNNSKSKVVLGTAFRVFECKKNEVQLEWLQKLLC